MTNFEKFKKKIANMSVGEFAECMAKRMKCIGCPARNFCEAHDSLSCGETMAEWLSLDEECEIIEINGIKYKRCE